MMPDAHESLPLASLFSCRVVVEQAASSLVTELLFPDERRHVAGAVAKRQAEFGTARICARRALARLGFSPCSLVPNPDRSPRWPEGVVGSMTHAGGYCAVVVARAAHTAGLGLDAEPDIPLDPQLEPLICTRAERRFLARCSATDRAHLGTMLFSAKEAFYKCQYPITRASLDLQDVDVCLDLDAQRFAARLRRTGRSRGPEWDLVEVIRGRFLRSGGRIVTAATLSSV